GVLGGIFYGLFSPTEAGAVGAVLASAIAGFRGHLSLLNIKDAIIDTAVSTCAIFVIAIGAVLFTRFMALTAVPDFLSGWLLGNTDNDLLIILQIAIIIIILGMFIDSIGILLLTLPILIPVVNGAEINLIWFGIIMIKLLEIGLITPPVGLNIYVVKSALGDAVSLSVMFRGVAWFVVADIATLLLLIAFPVLTLLLPSYM
ncbi:MAG: TRAP transporter large permease subunit, partial [Roseovarius sp.]|nr:TRAP transporter large permease subunit [Roseovarius sp.]